MFVKLFHYLDFKIWNINCNEQEAGCFGAFSESLSISLFFIPFCPPLFRPFILSYIFPFTVCLIYISLGVPEFSFTFLAHLKVTLCNHRVSLVSSSPDSNTCAGSLEGRKVNCLSQYKESQNIENFTLTVF